MTHPLYGVRTTHVTSKGFSHTVDPIDLDQVLKHRFVDARPGPVKGDGIGLNACKGNCGRIWDLDT